MRGHGVDRTGSIYGQVPGTCESGNEISGSIKCVLFLDLLGNLSFSRRTLLHGVSKYVSK
jgi:hypothetical protein